MPDITIKNDVDLFLRSADLAAMQNTLNVQTKIDGATLVDAGTPASDDKILIQDASDADTLKYVEALSIGGSDVTEDTVTDALDGATLVDAGTPASNDKILIQDTSDSNILKYVDASSISGGVFNSIGPLYILAQGQSNIVGALSNWGADRDINPNVKVWVTQPGEVDVNSWAVWDADRSPSQIEYGQFRAPLIVHSFAKKLQEITGREIRVIVNGQGSRSITEFLTVANGGTATHWNKLLSQLSAAGVPNNSIVARIFGLGETDSINNEDPFAWFKPKYEDLQDQFDALPEVTDNCPTLILEQLVEGNGGKMNQYWDTLKADVTGKHIVVPTRHLSSAADDLHYDGNGAIHGGRNMMISRFFGQALSSAESLKPFHATIACSDETTDLATGTAVATFRAPVGFTLTGVRASVSTAPVGSVITVDVNEGGVSVLSTAVTIDASEKTSVTAATPPVISDSAIADDAEITIDIDTVGSTTAGAGLKVTLIGTQSV